MRRRPGPGRVVRMGKAARTISDHLDPRVKERRPLTEIPLTLPTDLVVSGGRIYIRTRRSGAAREQAEAGRS
jgi:hypothetical protein